MQGERGRDREKKEDGGGKEYETNGHKVESRKKECEIVFARILQGRQGSTRSELARFRSLKARLANRWMNDGMSVSMQFERC